MGLYNIKYWEDDISNCIIFGINRNWKNILSFIYANTNNTNKRVGAEFEKMHLLSRWWKIWDL